MSGDAKDLKRKRPHGACESCKKRKKRCFHGADGENEHDSTDLSTRSDELSTHANSDPTKETTVAAELSVTHSKPVRFVGDTHAETNLEVEQDEPSERRDRDGVGMWIESSDEGVDSASSHGGEPENTPSRTLGISDTDKRALITIFMARVQPLLPILEASYTDLDQAMAMPETLSWAVCLVACKDQRARPHRRFGGGAVLPVSRFASKLHRMISRRLHDWRRFDRVVLIRVLTLMSTHHEGAEGAEEAAMQLTQAAHYAYSMGMHLNRASLEEQKQHDDARLFWCIWSLDKVNAAWNGRPRMSHEADVGLSFVDSLSLFDTPGRLWMKVARLLSSVIDLYSPRPCVDTESHIKDFPRWEFLLEEESIEGIDEGFLSKRGTANSFRIHSNQDTATLELFYHSVSMLSCRIKLLVGRKRAFASSLRRSLSAATVYSITRCVPPEDLAPLPVVPYAICLATLVAYQQYRCSQHRVHRQIAEEKLMHFQGQLETISASWQAARSMSRKVQRVLREFRRRNCAQRRQVGEAPGSIGTVGSSQLSSVDTPSNDLNDVPKLGTNNEWQASMALGPKAIGPGENRYGDTAFADMDATFGNLMDMNAFTGDLDFTMASYMDGVLDGIGTNGNWISSGTNVVQ